MLFTQRLHFFHLLRRQYGLHLRLLGFHQFFEFCFALVVRQRLVIPQGHELRPEVGSDFCDTVLLVLGQI